MYHAGTPESVKTYVINEIGKYGSQLRLIICTVAFGLGIDCKDIYIGAFILVHQKQLNCLSKNVAELGEMECSVFVMSYTTDTTGLLASYCNEHMKELITSKSCRRQSICKLFTDSSPLFF